MKHQTVVDASGTILRHLATHTDATQIELIGIHRLQRTAIFYVIDALKTAGFVRDTEKPSQGRGRPSILWSLDGRAGHFVAAYFDTFHNYYQLMDFGGTVLAEATTDATPDIEHALADLRAQVAAWPVRHLCGIAVGLSGIVDPERGTVRRSRRWSLTDFPLAARLASLFPGQAPLVIIDNNARLAAWGERSAGVCCRYDHFITLHMHGGRNATRTRSLGLGSGLILDGHLFRGFRSTAGELDIAFYQWLEAHTSDGRMPSSLRDLGDSALHSFAASLGETFAHLVNYLSPQGIVLVFDQEPPDPRFINAFERAVRQHLMGDGIPILVSALGERSVLPGGMDLLRRAYFDGSQQLTRYLEQALANEHA